MKKKTILSIMDSLEKINDSIIRNIDVGVQVSMETLVDCQDSAIAVGNEIEQQYGADGEDIVHLLEVYCENLYQMSSKSEDLVSCRKLGKKIQKQLVQIRNHIKYDLPDDKREVVFLPYKASMWDSLESVWKAADADPDCDAYVIPIPYFDKNPDGSFREEHYEGGLYPKDVPITRYDEYDLEARRPDVIYIHNPYDECNHVTSVHPYFYSKNLRNFTDKLVYIPYFILGEMDPEDQAAIDGMKHFCFTPGTIYAHQVIVESENMRQIYINEYMKAAKEMGLGGEHIDRKFLEKKFLGTGSPKIDKVLNTKREDLEIPEEWLKIIEKPDGSWKKIVFYNTGVSALLQYNEAMLRKMKSVFEIFKDNKDEVALLWRPHPLIQATIESMRPQLWKGYQEIRDRYLEEGWGIYDDSVDMDRAMVTSDAYYGDWSSAMPLYKKTGKLLMIQDVKLSLEDKVNDYIDVPAADVTACGELLWFTNSYGLFSINPVSQVSVLEKSFLDDVYKLPGGAFEGIKAVGEKVYLAPLFARNILVFNVCEKIFENIALDETFLGCKSNEALFSEIKLYGKYLYMIPLFSKAIVQINTENDTVEYINGWSKDVEKLIVNKKGYFLRQTTFVDEKLILPFYNANAVLELNCETLEYNIIPLGKENPRYAGISYDGTECWIADRTSGNLIQWNPKTNHTNVVKRCFEKKEEKAYSYRGVLCYEKKVMVFSAYKGEKCMEMSDSRVTVLEGAYRFAKEENDLLFFYREDIGKLIIINKRDGKKSEIELCARREDVEPLIKKNKPDLYEKKRLNVKNLIALLE